MREVCIRELLLITYMCGRLGVVRATDPTGEVGGLPEVAVPRMIRFVCIHREYSVCVAVCVCIESKVVVRDRPVLRNSRVVDVGWYVGKC